MPIYEYDCADCGEHFEIVASMSAGRGRLTCAHCGGDRIRRDYGGISIIHHGSGRTPGGGTNQKQSEGPRPGELRVTDPRRLTTNVATTYANQTGDRAIREVARRVDAGTEPDRLHDFVREVKADREAASGKHGVKR